MNGCQPYAGCTARRAFEIWSESSPVTKRGVVIAVGLQTKMGVCRSHADQFKNQVRNEGGTIVDVTELEREPDRPWYEPEPVAAGSDA